MGVNETLEDKASLIYVYVVLYSFHSSMKINIFLGMILIKKNNLVPGIRTMSKSRQYLQLQLH